MNPHTPPSASRQKTPPIDPFAITAGLLLNDIRILPSLLLLLSFYAVAGAVVEPAFWLELVDRILQLAVMSVVVLRWRKRLQTPSSPRIRPLSVITRIFGIGLSLWIVITCATELASTSHASFGDVDSSLPLMLGAVVLILSFVWCWRLFFYYVIAGFVGGTWRDVVIRALRIHKENPGAAARALAAPLSLSAIALCIFNLPFPDGRSLILTTLSSASQALFWLLSTYTGIGVGLSLFQPADWRALGLEGYSTERLQTLEIQGRSKLAKILTPRSALKCAGVAILLMVINNIRFAAEPPATKVEVTRLTAEDKLVRLELRATDTTHQFRGFYPRLLSLRGDSGHPISIELLKASTQIDKSEVLSQISEQDRTSITLFLEFSTDRNRKDFEALNEVWLWYGILPVEKLKVRESTSGQ